MVGSSFEHAENRTVHSNGNRSTDGLIAMVSPLYSGILGSAYSDPRLRVGSQMPAMQAPGPSRRSGPYIPGIYLLGEDMRIESMPASDTPRCLTFAYPPAGRSTGGTRSHHALLLSERRDFQCHSHY